ncbi:hypothetical protein Cch01nite_09740 [Cellulomonas chitinilytica]|uniref:Gram-positive cocci surface proteins LPxTG domain-containing protein n=1 Tax=Cellulomonas chitinilytica TaxID=398759 RepID=A0A919P102_9CELL|nr:MucBP domain-containing protein [Cellulomonas chitinilytica]GIG20250.1 hypothetical protein Cch01nite_09740 [Cellulomonas chitinilytica]
MPIRTGRRTVAALAATTVTTLVLTVVVGGAAQAAPGHPGTPDAPVVVFHEDFEDAPDTGARTLLSSYVTADGKHYTADPYWMSAPRANGLVLSWNNTKMPVDGTAADNGTEDTAFKVLRQLSEALGKVNGTTNPQTNTAISAYTQDTGKAAAGGKVMFKTDEDIQLKDSNGRFLAFEMSAAATSAAANKPGVGREDPELMFYVAQSGHETALTTAPINPITDPRASKVAVTALTGGAKEDVWAGQYASDRSFLYDGGAFGIVIRNMTSAHMGNDGAFDDIKVLDVTPQLDKQFGQGEATTGDSVRLTFTVTNTAELAQKTGWSFTDSLPAGMVVANEPGVVVEEGSAATVQANPGATAITVTNGDLVAGDKALTISLNVTSATAGTYSNGPTNITVRRGLDSPDTTTVTFKDPAPAPATLVVKHHLLDGTPLTDDITTTGKVGDAYTTQARSFDRYELISTPANAHGSYTQDPTVVTYVYASVAVADKADLTVLFVDENGNEIADSTFDTYEVGAEYGTSPKVVDGWTLKTTPANANGTIDKGHNVVVYVYTKDQPAPAKADLTVRWVDQAGNPLADETHRDGEAGEQYTTEARTFPGYELVAVPVNASGAMAEGTVVTYVYAPVVVPAKADLTVRFVDEQGNPLADPTHRDGTPGEHYTTAPAAVPGYELVAVPANASGEMAEGTEVTYVYRKVTPPVEPATPTTPETYVSEVLAAPAPTTAAGGLASTGSDAAAIGILAGALAAVGGLLVAVRRRGTQHR